MFTRTMLVGVGGVGSALLQPLAALLADQWRAYKGSDTPTKPLLTIVDGDVYEEKNLRNQCIHATDVGKNKAEVAAKMVDGLCEVEAWAEYLTGPVAVQSWLQEAEGEDLCLIVMAVDNDHCRKWIYEAVSSTLGRNVLVVDPSNGAGKDADAVDCVTWLRLWNPDTQQPVEPWLSPMVKYKQLRNPRGRNPNGGCAQKVASEPQLRTSNMRAALFCYDAIEKFCSDTCMWEEYHYTDANGYLQGGLRLGKSAFSPPDPVPPPPEPDISFTRYASTMWTAYERVAGHYLEGGA